MSAFGKSIQKTIRSLLAMGFTSGLMGTITGVGAPPIALLYHNSVASFARPTLASIFALGCLSSLSLLALVGWVGIRELLLATIMVPPMLLGPRIGRMVRSEFDYVFRLALLGLSGFAAIILVVKGLLGIEW